MNRPSFFRKSRHRVGFTSRAFIKLWVVLMLVTGIGIAPLPAQANPYLAAPGAAPVTVRAGTCATTGGFIHFYTALDNGVFDKYGIKVNHVYFQGTPISLAALHSDEIQFLYCAADATIPGIAAGIDAKMVASPLVGLAWVLLGRKDIKKIEDLKGKSIGVTRPGDFTFRLSRILLKTFNLTEEEVKIRPIGGSQPERYNALRQDIIQALLVTPPLDVRGKKDGFNVIYNLNELGLPFIYSSLHTNSKTLKERPALVQRSVAAIAEAIHFVEKNPEKAMASIAKVLRLKDPEALQSAYNAYARSLVNRRLTVPANAVAEAVENARQTGTNVKRMPADLFDNTFAENLDKSGFLKEIWGGQVPEK
ncbi:MAG: ABC transporter substrate-binding protein [Deltaproteobacteria bacterium]|nr:ABC transporter substrate-binding protein [Deltaproteobacteria bacterium]